MASSSTMNMWTEDLARSLLPFKASSGSSRRPIEHFTRSIRHHSYTRTNQYDVEDQLTGLEEKFQVLNNDELSDALRDCRTELKDYQLRWLPDMLDLLLRLSDDPVQKTRMTEFETIDNRSTTPPPLKWTDVEGDDPINRKDRLWRQPSYSDFSSDEGDVVLSSTATSPASLKHASKTADHGSEPSTAPETSAVDVAAAKDFPRCNPVNGTYKPNLLDRGPSHSRDPLHGTRTANVAISATQRGTAADPSSQASPSKRCGL